MLLVFLALLGTEVVMTYLILFGKSFIVTFTTTNKALLCWQRFVYLYTEYLLAKFLERRETFAGKEISLPAKIDKISLKAPLAN